ncbi:MAG TPA: hypothetical protein VLU54_14245 [Casimicrobiaceae bacterium]|nr:hypothetical protein [Casimicrobiaceae bacterium]
MRIAAALVLYALLALSQTAFATPSRQTLHYLGTTRLAPTASSASQGLGPEIHPGPEFDAHFDRLAKGSVSPARVPASHVPTPADSAVFGLQAGVGFDGLTHLDQRNASGGNQFSLEPPDQALAVGNGYVVEAVNTAIRVRSTGGSILVPAVGLNEFFGLAPAIDRSTGIYGPFTSDPKAYYDADTGRWFVTMLEIDQDPATGAFQGHSSVLIAVSQSDNPTGSWYVYSLDTTNAGDPVNHPSCPCLGDQPLIGADANGFYVTTNEFPLFTSGFNGAQVYAMSKAALEGGGPVTAVAFGNIPLAEGPAYSLQPATTAPGGAHASGQGGTEYLMSALDFNNSLDNRIAVWALTNTSSLNSATPAVALQSTIVDSQVYGAPPSAQQKPGPLPLADFIKGGGFGVKASAQILPLVDGNDDRMQQVTWADGKLWSSLNTVVKPANGVVKAGTAYFIVAPGWNGSTLGGSIVKQGYLSVSNHSLIYPSIGVNSQGKGVIAFSVVGDSVYPSAAYAPIDAVNGAGAIRFAALGAAPDDGFTGYALFGGRVGRWGDYSAAVSDADGSIWFANEYIPGGTRTLYANWGTFIGHVTP